MTMPEINRRQAMVPRGATVLPNPNGTAPGLWVERASTAIVLLPGPPREMKPMFEAVVRERLAPNRRARGCSGGCCASPAAPSRMSTRAQPVYGPWLAQPVPISTTILAVLGQIELHLTAQAPNQADADAALDAAVLELQDGARQSIYSVDGAALEAVVGDLLRSHGLTIAVAESCTGGLLSSRLTDVPGSSDYVDRGVVCYSNRAKIDMVGVPEALIAEHGAVSEPVAQAMADGMRSRSGATSASASPASRAGRRDRRRSRSAPSRSPSSSDDEARVRTFQFVGGREQVKFQAAQAALNMLRLMLDCARCPAPGAPACVSPESMLPAVILMAYSDRIDSVRADARARRWGARPAPASAAAISAPPTSCAHRVSRPASWSRCSTSPKAR